MLAASSRQLPLAGSSPPQATGSQQRRAAAVPAARPSRRRQLLVQATTQSKQASSRQRSRVLPPAPQQQPQREQQRGEHPELQGLSFVRGPTDVPQLDETIGECLARTAQAFPDNDAVVSVHQGVRLSYRQFHEQVEQAARGLLSLGIQKGDRVGIWAPNCVEWVVLQYATSKIGAILVNINPAYRAGELAYALNQSAVTTLVLARGLKGSREFIEIVDSVVGQTQLRHRILLADEAPEGYTSWAALRAAGAADGSLVAALAEREAQLQPDDPINIQYTSGTTGHPKAATLSHRNILNNGLYVAHTCKYTDADRVCIPVPLYHCFGMVIGNMACITSGAAMVYPAESFNPQATLEAVQAEHCTSLYGVPTMFIAELALPNFSQFKLDSLRTGVMAGTTCPVDVMKRVRSDMHMSDVTICYGMTETSPVSFQTSADDTVERRVSTVGRVHPHLEAKVIDPGNGKIVPHGTVGELCVRGYSVMLGYYGDEAATAAVLDQEGWMRTGDLGTIDAQGYCNIVGRIKDMVIWGGENIYPREIEEFLHGHPAVADVHVFGVPSKRYGEELCAWIKLRSGFEGMGRAELRAWCQGQIARYKVPRYWKFVESFPMTASGKPQKYKMREAAIAELGLGGK
ncbi:AMP-binding isoform A [Chlorella sorokiniana]|uniref:AMP-binding isoform A n=1 Tax=Chlorella sorokiniana TaxID=3076 RepID=A0A2P6THP4_CHLSO|nr:AMP-binding isoform A [Chlorella sorokiniana]|eukprot:PRW33815.1 AMP-binding isoform A [Chlorella sorokiniana]